jgi:hypothetical protein
MGMKISKEWANNQITHFGIMREQQVTSLRTKFLNTKRNLNLKLFDDAVLLK